MKNISWLFMLCFSINSCKRSAAPPDPIAISVPIGEADYLCSTPGNPTAMILINYAKLRFTITGVPTPQFSITSTFSSAVVPSATTVTQQNNTLQALPQFHSINGDCVSLLARKTGAYTISAIVSEGYSSPCTFPNGQCGKYFKSQSLAAGSIPMCALFGTNKIIIDATISPNVFFGPCL